MTRLSEVGPQMEGHNRLLGESAQRAVSLALIRAQEAHVRPNPPDWMLFVFVERDDIIVQMDICNPEPPHVLALCIGSKLAFLGPRCVAIAERRGEDTIKVAAQMQDGRTWAVTVSVTGTTSGEPVPTSQVDSFLFESFWCGVSEEDMPEDEDE